ncbi:hypothetical protein GOV12_06525 [Candidatus Pacearchaeota archaeon]|nr:hypothetical protein [Candidatus Pacearchaeota archaeon]
MGLFNFLKKKKVPDELPQLVSDEIENDKILKESDDKSNNVETTLDSDEPIENVKVYENPIVEPNISSNISRNNRIVNRDKITNRKIDNSKREIEDSYFNELGNDLNKEIEDLNKLENWYKNKFLPRDIVSDMRKHWEGKKNSSVINVLGRNFKDRINERTSKLQDLEREWQDIYFDLIEKEEEIREQEKELKKMLSEFVEICKRKKKQKAGKK